MYLPELSNIIQSKVTIDIFGGVNKREDCKGNEFIDMKNMSSDNYPCISPRKKRYESDFSWYLINKIAETRASKTNLYLDLAYTSVSTPYMMVIFHTKIINDECMDNDTIKFIIQNYKDKYIKLGENYHLIRKMELTTTNLGNWTGILAMYFDNSNSSKIISGFQNPPPNNLYNLYIKDSEKNYVKIPYVDKINALTNETRMVYVNNCFYWLKNGCINYSLYLNDIKAVCTYQDVSNARLSVSDVYLEKIKFLFNACKNSGEKLKITVDGQITLECNDVGEKEIVFSYGTFEVGREYTLSIETNNDVSDVTIGTLTDECDGDTDLIVGGNKIISIPSMYAYDTKYSTEERLSDKAEFCLDNGNSNNITIKRVVEDDGAVTWRFTVNTVKSANFWRRTVVDEETGKTIKKGYELNEEVVYTAEKSFIYFYSSDKEEIKALPNQYKRSDGLPDSEIKVTEIAANKITFEMSLGKIDYVNEDNVYASGLDYKLRKCFSKEETPLENSKDEEKETTVRTVSSKFLGYEPSYDSIIGYVANGEMDKLPFNIKFACASDNRLFACNQEGDRIFISAIGRIHDFVNEENGTMSADDIGVLSEGNFTGIVSFNHNVYFFKEKCVHKLYGTYSEDWQLVEYHINGVQENAERSIVVYDNFVIYKGTDAFYMYDGSTAINISEKLGDILDISSLKCCFAGGFKNKYYAYCEVATNDKTVYTTYVYDIERSLWHIEENNSEKGFVSMCSTSRGLLALEVEKNEDIDIMRVINISGMVLDRSYEENDFLWSATTGDLLTDLPDNKYFTKLQLRLWVDDNSWLGIDIKYDNDEWEKIGDNITATNKGSIVFPIIPRRCDHLALRFNGKGNAKIFSITETIEEASEI